VNWEKVEVCPEDKAAGGKAGVFSPCWEMAAMKGAVCGEKCPDKRETAPARRRGQPLPSGDSLLRTIGEALYRYFFPFFNAVFTLFSRQTKANRLITPYIPFSVYHFQFPRRGQGGILKRQSAYWIYLRPCRHFPLSYCGASPASLWLNCKNYWL
jgi:hypothetical protein